MSSAIIISMSIVASVTGLDCNYLYSRLLARFVMGSEPIKNPVSDYPHVLCIVTIIKFYSILSNFRYLKVSTPPRPWVVIHQSLNPKMAKARAWVAGLPKGG